MIKYNTSLRSTPNQRPHSKGEDCQFPVLVEPGESLPLAMMIEMQMNAGVHKQVESEMQRLYHFGPTEIVPDEFTDPFQDFNANMQVANQLRKYLEAKIRDNEEKMEEAKAAAKKLVEDAKSKPEPDPPG